MSNKAHASQHHETNAESEPVTEQAASPVASAHKGFKRKEAILLPSYSIKDLPEGTSIFVRVDSKIESKPNVDETTGKIKQEKGKDLMLHIVKVTDLETGERGEMVLPFMIQKAFEQFGDDYVGKMFEFIKGKKKGRTNEWTTYELEA